MVLIKLSKRTNTTETVIAITPGLAGVVVAL